MDENLNNLFLMKDPLGGGSYGSVNLAETLFGGQKIVVKFINL